MLKLYFCHFLALCVCMYLFAIDHKNVIIYIYKFVKSRIDKNNNVCDAKHIPSYTNLVYLCISDCRDSLKKLL